MKNIGSQKRDSARRKALDNIPSGLNETYVRDLDKLKQNPEDNEIGHRAFTWLLYCSQPLRLSHLATAAAINPDDPFTDDQKLDEKENIFDFCRSMIYVNLQTNVVEFSHISVREFFLLPKLSSDRDNPYYRSPSEGNAHIMKCCFMYLNYLASPKFHGDNFATLSHLPNREDILPKVKEKFRDHFAFYAFYEWPTHAKRLDHPDLTSPSLEFLTDDRSFPAWRELYEVPDIRRFSWWEADGRELSERDLWSENIVWELRSAARSDPGTPLYYATAFDLISVVDQLLAQEHDPNELGGRDACPLFVAIENRNLEIAELLISKGADVNVKDPVKNDTALHRAVARKDTDSVRFLLQRGADHKVHNGRGQAPINFAIHMDGDGEIWFSEIIGLLAQFGVDVKDIRGRTAMHTAAEDGCVLSAALLLQHGATVDAIDDDGRTALHIASLTGRATIVDMLLTEDRAEIQVRDHLGYTAMHLAVRAGNTEIVEKLFAASGNPLGLSDIYYVVPPTKVFTPISQYLTKSNQFSISRRS